MEPRWSGHVLICGLHGVGLRIVEQLHRAGVPVVVVDDRPDDRAVRVVTRWGVPHVAGNARRREVLEQAGLATALAVVCVESDDLAALETTLLVHELRPDVRLVVRLRNDAVRRAVGRFTGPVTVLDVAELAAPAMVEACLQRTTHDLELGGTPFTLVDLTAGTAGTLRSLYADLAPVAVVPAGGGDVVACPGRDHPVRPGDRVHLVGSPEQVAALAGRPASAPAGRRLRRPARHLVAAVFAEVDRPLRIALAALLAFVVGSTAVLTLAFRETGGRRMSLLDAIYFSVETVTTIGYGDYNFSGQATWLRIVSIGMMVSGAVLLASFVALLTNLLVSRRLEVSLGRRRVGALRGHAVVIGLGSVGLRVVAGLRDAGQDVVVLERDEDNRFAARVRALGARLVVGDATTADALEAVNLSRARAVAVMTSDDLTNIETALSVREVLGARWARVPVVLRLFDRQLGRAVARDFGLRHARSTAALAAPWFVGAALGLEVLGTFYVEQEAFCVGRLRVAPDGGLAGLAMGELSASTRVIAIGRAADGGRLEHPPRRGTRFEPGDLAYLLGPYEELLQVLRRDAGTDRSTPAA